MKKIKKVSKPNKVNSIKTETLDYSQIVNSKIKKDLFWTIIYIFLSFISLIVIKYLEGNFFFNKFF
jgi:hypothetical protein